MASRPPAAAAAYVPLPPLGSGNADRDDTLDPVPDFSIDPTPPSSARYPAVTVARALVAATALLLVKRALATAAPSIIHSLVVALILALAMWLAAVMARVFTRCFVGAASALPTPHKSAPATGVSIPTLRAAAIPGVAAGAALAFGTAALMRSPVQVFAIVTLVVRPIMAIASVRAGSFTTRPALAAVAVAVAGAALVTLAAGSSLGDVALTLTAAAATAVAATACGRHHPAAAGAMSLVAALTVGAALLVVEVITGLVAAGAATNGLLTQDTLFNGWLAVACLAAGAAAALGAPTIGAIGLVTGAEVDQSSVRTFTRC